MESLNFRNPNEAIAYLKKVQMAMDSIIHKNSGVIKTIASTRNVKVLNLEDLGDSNLGAFTNSTSTTPKSRSKLSTRIPMGSESRIPPIKFKDGDVQAIRKLSIQYRQTQALLADLKMKSLEWKLQWGDNPHMKKLVAELEVTRSVMREALKSVNQSLSNACILYCPLPLLNLTTDIQDSLSALPCSSVKKKLGAKFVDDKFDTVIFYANFVIKNLKTHFNHSIPSYIVVVSHVINIPNNSAISHLTTMLEYDGDHDVGAAFKGVKGAMEVLATLMDLDKIDLDVHSLPFPDIELTPSKIGDAWVSVIHDIDIDPDTKRLSVRTNKFIPDQDQEELLKSIMVNIPEYLRKGNLRIDSAVEAFVIVNAPSNRHDQSGLFDAIRDKVSGVKPRYSTASHNIIEYYVKDFSFKNANRNSPLLRKAAIAARATVKSYGTRNVFTFGVGISGRTDIRALRAFIDSLSDKLDPKQILKVRKSLGV